MKNHTDYSVWGEREMIEELLRRNPASDEDYQSWGFRELIEELERTDKESIN